MPATILSNNVYLMLQEAARSSGYNFPIDTKHFANGGAINVTALLPYAPNEEASNIMKNMAENAKVRYSALGSGNPPLQPILRNFRCFPMGKPLYILSSTTNFDMKSIMKASVVDIRHKSNSVILTNASSGWSLNKKAFSIFDPMIVDEKELSFLISQPGYRDFYFDSPASPKRKIVDPEGKSIGSTSSVVNNKLGIAIHDTANRKAGETGFLLLKGLDLAGTKTDYPLFGKGQILSSSDNMINIKVFNQLRSTAFTPKLDSGTDHWISDNEIKAMSSLADEKLRKSAIRMWLEPFAKAKTNSVDSKEVLSYTPVELLIIRIQLQWFIEQQLSTS